ncbi:MAG: hypothetical protein K2W95_29455 [Candidatus Obscuribacterales bacterium]|nr:hypothetical protein [Candidatus Obscuribacterales bacterium]
MPDDNDDKKKKPILVAILQYIQETSRDLWKQYGELAGVWIAGIAMFLLFGAFLTNCEKLVIPR